MANGVRPAAVPKDSRAVYRILLQYGIGKIGEQAGVFLTNLCEAMSTSSEPNVSVHEQTELHPKLSIENFGLDLEILESRVDSVQSLINTHKVLLVEARDLVNKVTRIRGT